MSRSETLIHRVASQWLHASHADTAAIQRGFRYTRWGLEQQIPKVLPQLTVSYKGIEGATPAPQGFVRWVWPARSRVYAGIFPHEDIPFQIGWDTVRGEYKVTSFGVMKALKSLVSLIAFMSDGPKVAALVKQGLKTLDPGTAAYYSGKLTEDTAIKGVAGVKAEFDTLDEWHDTTLTITLALNTQHAVPRDLVYAWLRKNWSTVLSKAPDRTPKPSRQQYDYDGPATGLGWIAPNRMNLTNMAEMHMSQSGKVLEVRVTDSTR